MIRSHAKLSFVDSIATTAKGRRAIVSSFRRNGTRVTNECNHFINAGPQPCHIDIYAKDTGAHNVYPYQVPNGSWQELSPNSYSFVSNPSLTVTCNSGELLTAHDI
jgi:hypothetical protein